MRTGSRIPSALFRGALVILLLLPGTLPAQEKSKLDSLYDQLDELFAEDSLSENLFAETDSLLKLMEMRFHSLSIRGSYTSRVLNSGRDLGYSQNGFIGGLSYYHPSGLYAEATGYMNSEYAPQYYLTDLGAGYLWDLDKWLLQAGHNFQIYDQDIDWIFNKNIQASVYYQRRHWETGIDYRFMYGREQAHRIIATAASRLSWRGTWFDRISLIPALSVQWGNSNIIFYRQSDTPVADLYYLILEDPDYPDLDKETLHMLARLLYRERYMMAYALLRENGYTVADINNLIDDYQQSLYREDNAFGLMNIALGLGLSLSKDRWNLYVNYTYNFPHALPGEDYEYENNDYLNVSLFYTVIWPGRSVD